MAKQDAVADLSDLLERMPSTPSITRASVRPGDVIVLECEHALTSETAQRLKEYLRSVWPDNDAIVLADGLKLKIAERVNG